jgi:uroporphyrinogen decarboxylase
MKDSAEDISKTPADLAVSELEIRLARFHERLARVMDGAPATKEWVRQAIHRKGNGRCPVWLNRISPNLIVRHGDALADLYCRYPDHVIRITPYDFWIGHQPPQRVNRVNPVEIAFRSAEWEDEWGTRWSHSSGGVGATPVAEALTDWAQLDEYIATRLPDPGAVGRLELGERVLRRFGHSRYCFGAIHLTLFERLHSVRGLLNVFEDFYEHETELRRLVEALADYALQLIRRWGGLGADAVFLTDDWGSQTGLLISPKMWRELFQPHYQTMFDEAHRLGMDVIFHSDGNVMAIIDDLIEIGLDVLDPLQPGAMDHRKVAELHGGKLSFCGGIDLQYLVNRGTPPQIRTAVRELKKTLGQPWGGGYIVSPSNIVGPEVPLANLEALFQAAHE